ncbi:hypothetical protein AU468_08625 [Alkalispirochaeta sphaeroplastigenens]|uniref:Uncharacterized protein n=1 Tax=Alkalispirochaeta sphaeroplastigenens TaxID=1187066 RepID=A0A2S4JNN3_9SPIO|nr:hypothetical protein [Alkalispirochaeta sphaeroplastigenens]POR01138.1 hypothetical protein AU468_08625 [Alkalispirochaeta sphaeroplastigenens]
MAIQPIDLQTLFVRLSTVGREQAALKQAVAQNQIVTGEEIARRSQDSGHTVGESSDVSPGPETVDDQETSGNRRPPLEKKDDHQEESGADREGEDRTFRDPDLGQHIDLSG